MSKTQENLGIVKQNACYYCEQQESTAVILDYYIKARKWVCRICALRHHLITNQN